MCGGREMNLGVAVKEVTILRAWPCPYEHNAQSFTGFLFPTVADNAIWVQLFHLD